MSAPSRPLASNPHIRDLTSVAAYCLAIVGIAIAVYAGVWAAAPGLASGVLSASQAVDGWSPPEPETRTLSNFERWLADREAAKHPPPVITEREPKRPVAAMPPPPTGIAAAAKAKALAEMARGRGGSERLNEQDDAVLPAGAQPAEQTGYTPPAADKHRVY